MVFPGFDCMHSWTAIIKSRKLCGVIVVPQVPAEKFLEADTFQAGMYQAVGR